MWFEQTYFLKLHMFNPMVDSVWDFIPIIERKCKELTFTEKTTSLELKELWFKEWVISARWFLFIFLHLFLLEVLSHSKCDTPRALKKEMKIWLLKIKTKILRVATKILIVRKNFGKTIFLKIKPNLWKHDGFGSLIMCGKGVRHPTTPVPKNGHPKLTGQNLIWPLNYLNYP